MGCHPHPVEVCRSYLPHRLLILVAQNLLSLVHNNYLILEEYAAEESNHILSWASNVATLISFPQGPDSYFFKALGGRVTHDDFLILMGTCQYDQNRPQAWSLPAARLDWLHMLHPLLD